MQNRPSDHTSVASVGPRIRELRQVKGLTQEELAKPEFTKGYVSALERSVVRPSFRALEVFARKLGVPIAELVAEAPASTRSPVGYRATSQIAAEALQAIQEDLAYQANYARMLIRQGQTAEAFNLIADLEKNAEPYRSSLPPDVLYLVPFLRGRAYLQMLAPDLARPELENALEIVRGEAEAQARVRNLLGVVFYEQSQPHLALEQHKLCLESIKAGEVRDLNFQVSVYGNLANEYWALNEPGLAIGAYKEILPLLEDLNDMEHQAHVYWGMASAYKLSQDWLHARLYATKALHIYEAGDNRAEAAAICLSLAETLIHDQRLDEASEQLARADNLLAGTGNLGVSSNLYRNYSEVARQQGSYDKAGRQADQSIALALAYYDTTRPSLSELETGQTQHVTQSRSGDLFWQDPVRVYSDALQIKALVEEAIGDKSAADHLFERALTLVEVEGSDETKHTTNLAYAKVLQARGDFERAVQYYQVASEIHPRGAHSRM